MQQPNNTEEFLRLISSSHTEDKWRGLLMATGAVRNWTEEEVLAVLENIGNSFLVGLLENSEKQRDVKSNESADLISLSLSLLASSCVSHKVCQGKFWSDLLPHLANMILRESKTRREQEQLQVGILTERVVNCWIVVCSVCSVQDELLRWFLKNSSLQKCMVELCKHMVKNETLFNNSQKQKQLVQLVVGMSYLALVLSKTIEAIRVRMLLPHMLLVVVVFFDRLREPSVSLDIIHQLYLLSPYFCSIFRNEKQRCMKSVVWQLDGHLRNAIEYSLSNRLNDALRHKLFSIVVGELKIWKLFEFNFTENMLSTSSLWRYMRLLLFMCSVELGVHLREVLRAPMDSLENENNREIHLVNIFQVIELSIDLLQRRMIETEEQPSESLRAEEREEVKVIEALVENIQVIVDFLEAEPLKREQKDDRQYIRLFKYSIVGFRIVCCFSSLQLPVLEKRISLVLVYSWNTILDDFEVILTSIEWDILYDLISWTGFGVTRLIEYSDIAMKTFECEIFSRVWIQLLQEFVKNRSIISTMTGSIPVTQVIYNIIEILVCLYEFPSNRRYINDHKDTLMSIRTLWPSEELKKLFTSDEVSHVVASQ